MTNVVQSLGLFLLPCLFHMLETGQISPPRNLSILWITDFHPKLSWAPPQHPVTNCTYVVASQISNRDSELKYNRQLAPPWQECIVMDGGLLKLSVETVCNDTSSEPAVLSVTYSDLVTDLECYAHSFNKGHCSWLPACHAPDLRFFYWRLKKGGDPQFQLQECSSYSYTEGMRTGCNLQVEHREEINILFNATVGKIFARNTFKKHFIKVRPPPLNWTVTKSGDKFNITWTPPDIPNILIWRFIINYTECGKEKVKTVDYVTSYQLDLVPACPYRMAIKARHREGETPWSDEKMFDADIDPNVLVYLAIIIPLMFAGLAALMFVCCRKNKEYIFPKVPQPRDLLSDISNNNTTKSTVYNLYIPVEEEENCKITVVTDQINKPDC